MNGQYLSIFIVPSDIAKVIHGRYVCLMREGEEARWITEDSIVDLSKQLSDIDLDWSYIERELLEKNVFSLDKV